jgi:beta-N-acetylhexosaminidase
VSKEKARTVLFVTIAADDDPIEGATLATEIQTRAASAKIARLDPRSTKEDYDKILSMAKTAETIILAPFVKRAALKGTVALPENQTDFVKQMLGAKKTVAVVAFGSPYLIRQFPAVRNYVVTYAIEEVAQTAAAKTMFGEVPFQGVLPVDIPNLFQIGAGLAR